MKWLLVLLLLISQSACINTKYLPSNTIGPTIAYLPLDAQSDISQFAPVFLVEENDLLYNRIGTPSAINNESNDLGVYVDPEKPTIYVQELSFNTENASYKNYVYRIHFKEVPFSLFPFHLTSGKNVGLIVIVTINKNNNPVLITTVHTCGCYLSFVPTSFLAEEAYPPGWDTKKQRVYGENLPGLLSWAEPYYNSPDSKIVILLKSGTHRVKWLSKKQLDKIKEEYHYVYSHIAPMEQLKLLGRDDEAISFFETSGSRKGYVKESHKPFERILMSWWAMDLYVGEDKDFGPSEKTGTLFYTSLKFWDRDQSDMWNFRDFLSYWGWKL